MSADFDALVEAEQELREAADIPPLVVYSYVPGRRSPIAVATDALDEVVYRIGTAARVLLTGRV